MFNRKNLSDHSGVRIAIRELKGNDDAKKCARMMTDSEPWILEQNLKVSLEMITDPARKVYLGQTDNTITGFVILDVEALFLRPRLKVPAGYIQAICVAEKFRNRGIGSQLISFAEARVLRNVQKVCICLSPFAKGSRRLYERLGYEAIDQLTDGDILMAKALKGVGRSE